MKILTLAAFSLVSLGAAVAPKPVNYSGSWSLDKAQSKGLPQFYDRVRSHDLRITQHGMTLDVAVSIDVGNAAPDTMRLVYTMDGRESHIESPMRGPNGLVNVPTTLRAVVNPDRQVHIVIGRDLTMAGSSFHATTTEDWKLSTDGRTLTVHRTDESPRGTRTSDMVFVRTAR